MMDTDKLAQTLWNYNVLNQLVKPGDCVLALGNSDIRTAQRAAELYNQGLAKWLITTGGYGRLTKDDFSKPEAVTFAEEAMRLGVPNDKILIEDQSSNTFDNLSFTQKHLEEMGITAQSIIVVTKPYMERRAIAMVQKTWPDKTVSVTSPAITFEDYPNAQISKELLINMLVGDTQRIIVYGEQGKLIKQTVPVEVTAAMKSLIEQGYD